MAFLRAFSTAFLMAICVFSAPLRKTLRITWIILIEIGCFPEIVNFQKIYGFPESCDSR